jgi:hypothetical protein
MRVRDPAVAIALGWLGACYTPPEPPPEVRLGRHETSELVLQAVDAGTGGPLSDDEMTVRYLVRAPITFDASEVERVPSIEPYHIAHDVAHDALVLEVRLEAPSYHGVDTVVSVPRGSTAGPLTLRLSRRLDLTAEEPEPEPTPPPVRPAANRARDGEDLSPLQTGNAAYNRRDWLSATEAYQRMPPPVNETSTYGQAYAEAKTRQGIAHINRSEYARALEVLEEAADLDSAGPNTFLRLAEAQCAVGRVEEGRGTLAQLARARSRMTPTVQNLVSAMIAYRRGVCTHGEFERAQTTRERVRTGAAAMQELQGFIQGAEQMSPQPQEVLDAMEDAERRVELIRRSVGGEDLEPPQRLPSDRSW